MCPSLQPLILKVGSANAHSNVCKTIDLNRLLGSILNMALKGGKSGSFRLRSDRVPRHGTWISEGVEGHSIRKRGGCSCVRPPSSQEETHVYMGFSLELGGFSLRG